MNLSQLLRVQDDGERSEVSHTSHSMSISNISHTPKAGLNGDGGFGALNDNVQGILGLNNQIQHQAARELAMNPNSNQGQGQRRAPKNQILNQVSQPLKFGTGKQELNNNLVKSFSSSSFSSSLSSHQDELVEDKEIRN